MAQLISKVKVRVSLLATCDFTFIHLPIKLSIGHLTKETLEQLLQENEIMQFVLNSLPGKISTHCPGHKLFNIEFNLVPKEIQSHKLLKALFSWMHPEGLTTL